MENVATVSRSTGLACPDCPTTATGTSSIANHRISFPPETVNRNP
jgi:hypothetical protein